MRYFFGIQNPEDLPDEEWAMRVRELEYIRKELSKSNDVGMK